MAKLPLQISKNGLTFDKNTIKSISILAKAAKGDKKNARPRKSVWNFLR